MFFFGLNFRVIDVYRLFWPNKDLLVVCLAFCLTNSSFFSRTMKSVITVEEPDFNQTMSAQRMEHNR